LRQIQGAHELFGEDLANRGRFALCHQHGRLASLVAVVVEIKSRGFTTMAVPFETPAAIGRQVLDRRFQNRGFAPVAGICSNTGRAILAEDWS
jgi:hypothetical protein